MMPGHLNHFFILQKPAGHHILAAGLGVPKLFF